MDRGGVPGLNQLHARFGGGDPRQFANPHLRAAIMEVIENQLCNNDPPQTAQTFKRLIQAGHSKKEAKRLIAEQSKVKKL